MKLKYSKLRNYIKNKNLRTSHKLQNCDLVIDGDSFFKNSYKKSDCRFILGPECDRYADFIIKTLSNFLDNNIKCYVIFNGATRYDLDKRKEILQDVIEGREDIEQDLQNAEYFTPLFVKDVQKQVLKEMNIKYFVCEYESVEAIIGVARKFKCPVLTNNIEYCLFGVSCIEINSVVNETKPLECTIYEHETCKTAIGVYNKIPLLLTILNENGDYLEKLSEMMEIDEIDVVPVKRWIKRERVEAIIQTVTKSIDDNENQSFTEVYEKIKHLYLYPLFNLAVKYFQREKVHGLFKDDKKWFAKGVSNGRIAVPYVNLKKKGIICGSTIMYNSKKPDALLAAIDIIAYSHCLLTNSQDSTITFVGRKGNNSCIWEINSHWDKDISNRDIFNQHQVKKIPKALIKFLDSDAFKKFLREMLPGFFYNMPTDIPEDCKILIITLIYYIYKKRNDNFITAAYSVLLSYIVLGPVSKNIELLKKCGISSGDYKDFYDGLNFLFKRVENQKYCSELVHSFSEFQHCLQYMNYLNKLCGEKIPCTVYHDTYNATFIYNTYLYMNDKNHLMRFLENNFKGTQPLQTYKEVVSCFEKCLSAAKANSKNDDDDS